jgi:hypothetical protein
VLGFEDMLACFPRRAALHSALVLTVLLLGGAVALAASPGSLVLLTQGTAYRARLRLNFLQCLASRDRIGRKLKGGGFGDVRIFMSSGELPGDWPAQFRGRAGSCERYVEGTWVRPTMPRPRPSAIEAWWVASAPP